MVVLKRRSPVEASIWSMIFALDPLTPAQRVEALAKIAENYCVHCGQDGPCIHDMPGWDNDE